MMARNRPRRLLPFIALLCLLMVSPGVAAASGPAYGAIIASQRTSVQAQTADALSTFSLNANFTPAKQNQLASLTGRLALHWINATGAPQAKLYLRLYPNSAIYPEGGMTIDAAAVNGKPAAVSLSVGDTVATIDQPGPVAPGASTDLSIAFTTLVPTDPRDTYGMFQLDSATNVYSLANWFPILAGFDPSDGWQIDPPATIGDPVFTNAALFDVQLTAPSNLVIAAGGSEIGSTESGGMTTHSYVAGPARDFVTAISSRFQTSSQAVGETTVTSYFLPGSETGGANALDFGARALTLYGERFGAYPYRQMNLVEMPLGHGAGGVEFPQLVFLASDYYTNDNEEGGLSLDFLVAHEVAHQWFYGQVGNNQYRHAFLDEALANVAAILDLQVYRGANEAKLVLNRVIIAPYRNFVTTSGDLVVDMPSESFPSTLAYNAIVYGKAPVGFLAIRDRIGEQKFDAGLALYGARHRFATAEPQDLLACLNEAAGEDLTSLWNHWFEEANGLNTLGATPVSETGA